MSRETRKYELKKRADDVARTRRRITDAAIDLHGTVGPSRTTLSAVAKRAGVERRTLYRHFPTEADLFAAAPGDETGLLYREVKPSYRPEWWVSLRRSNNEPLLRLNVEARSPKLLGPTRRCWRQAPPAKSFLFPSDIKIFSRLRLP